MHDCSIEELTVEEGRILGVKAYCGYGAVPTEDLRESLLKVSSRIFPHLPERVVAALISLRDIEDNGYRVVRGLPIDDSPPPTPTSPTADHLQKLVPVSVSMLLGLSRIVGEPISYSGEYDGTSVTSVAPMAGDIHTISSHSAAPLPMHTETIHLYPWNPSFVALYCIRADRVGMGKTLLASAADIVTRCPHSLRQQLRRKDYWVQAPKSFGPNRAATGPVSVIDGPDENPELRAETTDMRGITPTATAALAELHKIVKSCVIEVDLSPGDLLIFDNRKFLHGRTPFEARLDGTDRWLIRTLLMQDLWPIRDMMSQYHLLQF